MLAHRSELAVEWSDHDRSKRRNSGTRNPCAHSRWSRRARRSPGRARSPRRGARDDPRGSSPRPKRWAITSRPRGLHNMLECVSLHTREGKAIVAALDSAAERAGYDTMIRTKHEDPAGGDRVERGRHGPAPRLGSTAGFDGSARSHRARRSGPRSTRSRSGSRRGAPRRPPRSPARVVELSGSDHPWELRSRGAARGASRPQEEVEPLLRRLSERRDGRAGPGERRVDGAPGRRGSPRPVSLRPWFATCSPRCRSSLVRLRGIPLVEGPARRRPRVTNGRRSSARPVALPARARGARLRARGRVVHRGAISSRARRAKRGVRGRVTGSCAVGALARVPARRRRCAASAAGRGHDPGRHRPHRHANGRWPHSSREGLTNAARSRSGCTSRRERRPSTFRTSSPSSVSRTAPSSPPGRSGRARQRERIEPRTPPRMWFAVATEERRWSS